MIPYKVYSHYSIQRSASHVDDIVAKAIQLKLNAIALTDYHSISGIPEFIQLIDKHNKKSEQKIVPICGVTLRYADRDIIFIAKNKAGWKELIKLVSDFNLTNVITIDNLREMNNLLCIDNIDDTVLRGVFNTNYLLDSDLGNIPAVYYAEPDDKIYQQLVICSEQKIRLDTANEFVATEEGKSLAKFFNDNDLSLTTISKINDVLSDKLTQYIEPFTIGDKPQIPTYLNNNDVAVTNSDEYLTELCREGWKTRNINSICGSNKELRQVYSDRIKEELGTIKDAKMSNYFLIVRDIVQKCRDDKQSVGLRGSAVGCLVSYLIGITSIDPVRPDPNLEYDPTKSLVFARFLNKGRLQKDSNALADCDIDVVPSYRDTLKKWIRAKYGDDRCANIATFQKFKGAGAIKEVFRVLGHSFDLANEITSKMVSEAAVQDEIEDCREDNPKYNLINYCIDNIPEINNWYQEFKYEFDLAIHLTNTIRSEGQHAAGIIMANDNINTFIPISIDGETGEKIAKFKMQDVEYVGGVKFDLLSVSALEKIDKIISMINKESEN